MNNYFKYLNDKLNGNLRNSDHKMTCFGRRPCKAKTFFSKIFILHALEESASKNTQEITSKKNQETDGEKLSVLEKHTRFTIEGETGWDRVLKIFDRNELVPVTSELMIIKSIGISSCLVGGVLGGFIKGKEAHEKFLRQNVESKFYSEFQANRTMNDTMIREFGRGFVSMAWRFGLFSTGSMSYIVCMTAYRNDINVMDFVVGIGAAAGIWKIPLGVKAVVASCGLGAILGLLAGGLLAGLFKLSGVTVEEYRYYQHEYWNSELLKLYEIRKKDEQKKLEKIKSAAEDKK